MEKGIMLKGNGQAPAQLYMEKLLNGEQEVEGFFFDGISLSFLTDLNY